jgi:phosphatidylserine/phosphatidylglycerophosphate/cardiolipin synthase-like enzyme
MASPCRRTALVLTLLGLVVGNCSIYPPQLAVHRTIGGLQATMDHYAVRPLDPGSDVPLVEQAFREAAKTDPTGRLRGTTYQLTTGNHLPRDWLIQTPNVWGQPADELAAYGLECEGCEPDLRLPPCRGDASCDRGACAPLRASVRRPGQAPRSFCVGHSDALLDQFHGTLISARHTIDILQLQPPPDTRFLAALRNAITWLAYSGRPVTIRILIGSYPPRGVDVEALMGELVRDAAAVPNARLRIFVGANRPCNGEPDCDGISWNHAKAVAVDGSRAIVGGHNMWSEDNLGPAPVHDLSVAVQGPAAHDVHDFADALWNALCKRAPEPGVNIAFAYRAGAPPTQGCLAAIEAPRPPARPGGIPVLTAGRFGAGVDQTVYAEQSLVLRNLMLDAARHSIRMVQQDIAFGLFRGLYRVWPDVVLRELVDLMGRGGDVYLVLSNTSLLGPRYSNAIPLADIGWHLRRLAQRRTGLEGTELDAMLCRHLHLAEFRTGPDDSWAEGKRLTVHAKFWMVDDRVFYVGAENLYPTDLQELGYIIEDRAAAATARREYWDQLWHWSRRTAVSGSDAPHCMFDRTDARQHRP